MWGSPPLGWDHQGGNPKDSSQSIRTSQEEAQGLGIQQEVRQGIQGTQGQAPTHILRRPRQEGSCKSKEDEMNA